MKLTDEQINSIARGNHDGMLWKQDGGLGPALCEQAREANRLRAGLEDLLKIAQADEKEWISRLDLNEPMVKGWASASSHYAGRIERLLEGE